MVLPHEARDAITVVDRLLEALAMLLAQGDEYHEDIERAISHARAYRKAWRIAAEGSPDSGTRSWDRA